MTRLEELSLRWLDGDLTDAELEELRGAMAADPDARRNHAHTLGIEAALRACRTNLNFAPAVMQAIKEAPAPAWIGGAQTLAGADGHRHFLELFLVKLGNIFHMPWWAANFALYLITFILFAVFVDLRALFPHSSVLSLTIGLTAEFGLAAWMLSYIRRARAQGFDLAQRITSDDERSAWFRQYVQPLYKGWTLLSRGAHAPSRVVVGAPPATILDELDQPSSESRRNLDSAGAPSSARTRQQADGPPALWIPLWSLTILLLAVFYGLQFGLGLWPGAPEAWRKWCFPHVLWTYTNTVKAAMFFVLFSHLFWLRGQIVLAQGNVESSLTPDERVNLLAHSRKHALQFVSALGLAIGWWMFGNGLDFGFSAWSWGFSVGLAALFVVQLTVIAGLKFNPASLFRTVRQRVPLRQFTPVFQPVEVGLAFVCMISPVVLNSLGALARH